MSNAWDTSAREKRASHGAFRLWYMHWIVEKEQLAPRPDVSRWSESLSIRERAKGRRRTSVAAPFAPNWCPCAFIIRSSAVRACAMCRSAGSWSANCKLCSSIKLNSRAFKGEISLAQSLNYCWRFSVLVWSPFLNSWFRLSLPRQRRLWFLVAKARLRRWNPHQRDWDWATSRRRRITKLNNIRLRLITSLTLLSTISLEMHNHREHPKSYRKQSTRNISNQLKHLRKIFWRKEILIECSIKEIV